jgi:hypothetical protein
VGSTRHPRRDSNAELNTTLVNTMIEQYGVQLGAGTSAPARAARLLRMPTQSKARSGAG